MPDVYTLPPIFNVGSQTQAYPNLPQPSEICFMLHVLFTREASHLFDEVFELALALAARNTYC